MARGKFRRSAGWMGAGAAGLDWLFRNEKNIRKATELFKQAYGAGNPPKGPGRSDWHKTTPQQQKRKRDASSPKKGKFMEADSPGVVKERRGHVYKIRRFGAASSKSKGFVPKLSRKRTFLDRSAKGITICRERGDAPVLNILADCYYIGHATCTASQVYDNLGLAIVKFLGVANNLLFNDFQDFSEIIVQAPITTGLTVRIWGQPAVNIAPAVITNGTFTITASTTTYGLLAAQISTTLKEYNVNNPDPRLTMIEVYQGTSLLKRWDLSAAMFTYRSKSALKLQNRTINSTGLTEADEVDNVPLYGKSYEGDGNFFRVKGGYSSEGTIAPLSGVAPPTLENVALNTSYLAEPPKPSQLLHVKRNGTIHLDPGEIKTSVIYHSIKISLNTLMKKLRYNTSVAGVASPECLLGNYRVFALEKMLKVGKESSVSQMKVAYEIDQKDFCSFWAPVPKIVNTVLVLNNSPA